MLLQQVTGVPYSPATFSLQQITLILQQHLDGAYLCQPQICIKYSIPDAVPPIHGESYHVATDKGPSIVLVYF